jgi:predicted transcriptional regulator
MMLGPWSASTISSVTAAVPKVWWEFSQRRSKFEIYVEILELMKRGPMTPFEVAFYARLNHKRTKEYTEFLAQAGYLQGVNEDGKVLYALTKDGLGFLDRVQSLLVSPGIIEVTGTPIGYQRDF